MYTYMLLRVCECGFVCVYVYFYARGCLYVSVYAYNYFMWLVMVNWKLPANKNEYHYGNNIS